MRTPSGFTLLEILVVVAIIVVLAGIALPSYQDTMENAQVASTGQELQRVRTAIDYYAFQHQEQLPGWDGASWSEQTLRDQLLLSTDLSGNTAPVGSAGYPYGPYLVEGIPTNPFNQLATILVIPPGASFATPDDQTGWVYFAADGSFRANTTANDGDGDPIFGM